MIALMALDLPLFERPAKQTSAPVSYTNCVGWWEPFRYRAWGKADIV